MKFLRIPVLVGMACLGVPSFSGAAEVQLVCKTWKGLDAGNLTVDLEARTMRLGIFEYLIIKEADGFVTAWGDDAEIGGEIFVLERASGNFWRARVSMSCTDLDVEKLKCRSEGIRTLTIEGQCLRSVL